jgi:hypothetical protein
MFARRTSFIRCLLLHSESLDCLDVDLEGRVHVRRTRGRVKDRDVYRVVEGPVKTRASRRTVDVPRSVLLALPGSDLEVD